MPIEIKVPAVGESITEVQVAKWLKQEGEWVGRDEPVVELETEKTTLEVPAPAAGRLQRILVRESEFTGVDAVLALIEETAPPDVAQSPEAAKPAPSAHDQQRVMPAAQRIMGEKGIAPEEVKGTGPGGRVLKEDALRAAGELTGEQPPRETAGEMPAIQMPQAGETPALQLPPSRVEEVVPMSPMRLKIAQRLVEAQQNAALLTTFNEIDMHEVTRLRHEYQESFQKEYGIKLGLMSFFVKATIEALKRFPAVNAEIRGRNIVYKNYFDIGIAIGSGKGLVVPVLRNAEALGLARIEREIAAMAQRVQAKKITPEELEGGTFTISNGGVYGSLLSTPIINPPQSGILGMHAIQDRPVAREGQIVIRPMMYVALTYDHRIVDGREAVSFLLHLKEVIEEPSRILLEI